MTDSPAEQAVAAYCHNQRSRSRSRRRQKDVDKILAAIKRRDERSGAVDDEVEIPWD